MLTPSSCLSNCFFSLLCYHYDGSGRFQKVVGGAIGSESISSSDAAWGDYDNDGDLDLFITHWHGGGGENERNQLYRNDGQVGNWLKVRLEGVESNRSAIGARLILTAIISGKTVRQLRYVNGKTSWRGSSSHIQHFGFGNARSVLELRIEWPSGQEDVITGGLEANQTVTVKEGQGLWRQL